MVLDSALSQFISLAEETKFMQQTVNYFIILRGVHNDWICL